ncbi:MAG: CpsD/CapB family tyrosine-protein kinase [Firmicutes bacterium]|nr:CpsD/CapB family tyrosine-protein kinase [Bacillota bacterium]
MNSNQLITYSQPRTYVAESFRTLRANLQFMGVGEDIGSVLLVGGTVGEGASFVTANLGILFAQTSRRVIIVDCDLRKPQQHLIFNVDNQLGLTSVLSGFKKPDEVITNISMVGVDLLTTGPLPTNPAELLGGQKMSHLMADLKDRADVILLDAPPLTMVADAAVLSKRVDSVLLVVRAKTASHNSVAKTMELLNNAKARVLGAALNCARLDEREKEYHFYWDTKMQTN